MSAAPPGLQRGRSRPWYREPYVWLLITFPALAVVGGLATIVIAVVSDDGLVVDDYYRRGKEINRILERDRRAAALQLNADLLVDAQNVVRVELRALRVESLPERVDLNLAYATRAGLDQSVVLHRAGVPGHYAGNLSQPLTEGRWYVQLQTPGWRLVGAMQAPQTARLQMRVKP
ncbi:MAG: FixH family protein [Gammaproteobacteria bacterium]|nr:FixH family protein [Gammaproteobacteria bacterium]